MTPTPTSALLAELDALGLQLEADEDRLRFRPRDGGPAGLAVLDVRRRIRGQLTQLVPYKTPDGRRGWVNPRYRRELEDLGRL